MDRDVFATTDGARYATAIYGVLDTQARVATIVNAGHPSLLVLEPAAERAQQVGATGPALGLIDAGSFSTQSITLSPGTVMVAYTDGVCDAIDEGGDEFGDRRLEQLVSEHRVRAASAMCAAILDAVRAHRGSRQDQDDVTVMVIKASEAEALRL